MSKLRDIAYQIDPALWVREVLGLEPAAWQARFLRSPLAASIIALTARQVGKTTVAAWAITHHMLLRPADCRSLPVRRNAKVRKRYGGCARIWSRSAPN